MYAPDFRPSSASWRTWRASSLAVSFTLAAMVDGVWRGASCCVFADGEEGVFRWASGCVFGMKRKRREEKALHKPR
jgi:hypothetical protein